MRVVIAKSSSSCYWYAVCTGKEFTVFREEEDRYWVTTPNGYSNFIMKCDAMEVKGAPSVHKES